MKRLLFICCAKKYKIVFTDIQMPGMDGFAVAQVIYSAQNMFRDNIKKNQYYGLIKVKKDCPVVAVTAYTDQNTIKQAEEAGMNIVLHKPVSLDRLTQVVRLFINIKIKS